MRMSVEHAFGITQNLWTKNAYDLSLKIGEGPVGSYYRIGILLTNCYTCIRGNQIGDRFLVKPPSLRQYLRAS
jgi:hypothetical protein